MDWLDKILSGGLGVVNTLKQTDIAKQEAKAANANLQATTANAASTQRLLLIGGGVIAVVVVLAMVFRKR
jgi:CHASE3 domain sensor protein